MTTPVGAGIAGSDPAVLEHAAVRILDVDGQPVGLGFLVADDIAITCAHVVCTALGLSDLASPSEGASVALDLPLHQVPGQAEAATVAARISWWGPSQGGADLAVLHLAEPLPGGRAAYLVEAGPQRLWGHAARVFGLPAGRPAGVWHAAVLRGRQADGWIQVDLVGDGYRVSPGFSGSPVWDQELGGVVGMMVAAEAAGPAVSYLIPVSGLIAAWPRLAAVVRPPSPFRSLESFEEVDADTFFGRDADSDRIAEIVGHQRWTTLVGPSGCGKSSLAMAGVVPRRRDAGAVTAILRPAHHATASRGLAAILLDLLEPDCPEAEKFARISTVAEEIARYGMRAVAARILRVQHAGQLLIVIDQFEELLDEEVFTPADIDALAEALNVSLPPTVAVLAVLRADFLGPVLAHPRLGLLAKQRIEALEPMREEQLRDIVTKPIDALPAIGYEDGLVNRVLGDASSTPGVLPLLSFTLAQLWDRQRGGRLTHLAYDELGGVTGALGMHANRIWKQYVGDDDEEHAEKLLTRLVRTPIGTETPVRRLATRAELSDREWQIAQLLAGGRLLVLNRTRIHEQSGSEDDGLAAKETVELAHEALISGWDRLSVLVKADRAFLDWRENLQLDMDRWDRAGRPKDLLPTATVLAAAQRWLPERTAELGDAQKYLQQGRARRRLLTRRRRMALALFGVLSISAGTTAVVAINQRQTVIQQRDVATSAQVAGLAQSLGRTNPQLARRLAIAAASLGDTPEAWSALLTARYQPEKQAVKLPRFDVSTSDLDSDGRILAAGGGTQVGTWDVDTGKQLGSYQAPARVRNVRLSADGTTVAVSTDDDYTTVLEARGLHLRGRFQTGPNVFSLSPQGTYLVVTGQAVGSGDGVATVWDTRTGKQALERTAAGSLLSPSFSPDERLLSLTRFSDNGITWTDLHTGKDIPTPQFRLQPQDNPGPVAFSPDGGHAAMLTARGLYTAELTDNQVTYDSVSKLPLSESRASDTATYGTDVHFSHAGKLVALGFTLWDATLPADPVFAYPTVPSDCGPGTSRFSADDSELRCVGSDGTFHSLDISQLAAHGTQTSSINTVAAASQNGSTIAIPESGHTEIWSTAPLAKRTDLTLPTGDNVLLSPDGRLIAIQKSQDEVEVWDLARDTRLGTLPGGLNGFTKTVAFSPDDTGYVTYDRTENRGPQGVVNSLRFYDLRTMKLIRQESFTLKAAEIDFGTTVAFQPDGQAVTISPLLGTVAFPSGAILVHGTPEVRLNGYGPDAMTAYSDPDNVNSNLVFLDPRTLSPTGQVLNVGALTPDNIPIAHSPDGRLIAAVYDDSTAVAAIPRADEIKIWGLSSRRQLGPALTDTKDNILLTAFTADGSTLVSLDEKGVFRSYTVSPSQLVRQLCTMSGGLTKEEWKTYIPSVPYRKTC